VPGGFFMTLGSNGKTIVSPREEKSWTTLIYNKESEQITYITRSFSSPNIIRMIVSEECEWQGMHHAWGNICIQNFGWKNLREDTT
jgi:hypothetical protein